MPRRDPQTWENQYVDDWPWTSGTGHGRHVKTKRDKGDELESVETTTDSGQRISLTASKTVSADTLNGRFELDLDGSRLLVVESSLSKSGKMSLVFTGPDTDVQFSIDFRDDLWENAAVTAVINGQQATGTFDPAARQVITNPPLNDWLPERLKRPLKALEGVLADENKRYQKKAKDARTKNRGRVFSPPHSINWYGAACWGFAGMGSAGVCIIVPGAGCLLSGFVWGYTASVCYDSWSGFGL